VSTRKKIVDDNTAENYNRFMSALNSYMPEKLEVEPTAPHKIYEYYSCVDGLYIWLKNAYNDDICVLCNEIRAVMGHLSEYDKSTEDSKKNLGKAYGHFRRLSIDTLKILCNGFDQEFDEWISKHAHYDYRNIDKDYFPEYITLYYKAHKAYIDAQKLENLGSDKDNNIIKKYHDVAVLYGELYKHHVDDRRRKIELITYRFKFNRIVWTVCTFFLMVLSILGELL